MTLDNIGIENLINRFFVSFDVWFLFPLPLQRINYIIGESRELFKFYLLLDDKTLLLSDILEHQMNSDKD